MTVTWEQVVIASLMVIGCISSFVRWLRDDKMSSGEVALCMILSFAFYIFYVYVLHSGGFW